MIEKNGISTFDLLKRSLCEYYPNTLIGIKYADVNYFLTLQFLFLMEYFRVCVTQLRLYFDFVLFQWAGVTNLQ